MTFTNPDAYWVAEGQLMAGEYPGNPDETIARQKLQAVLDAGIRSFVDLTEAHELVPYDRVLAAVARERGHDVRYRRMSIEDVNVPTPEHMAAVLAYIADEIAAGRPVYVHCWGGIGRTGTVVGCWIGGGPTALEQLADLRSTCKKRRRPSPETSAQREFITSWTRPVEPA